ncbi:MAG: hypothetical protein ACP5XB_11615, partial [Isosphaeraceae bacterium]
LRARIADLHAEAAVLEVECAASRHNLLESLKKLGKLELGNKRTLLSQVRMEMQQLQVTAHSIPFGDTKALAETIARGAERRGDKETKGNGKLISDLLKGGDDADKALDRLAEIEFQARLDSARAETGRMKADFLKKCRLLYQKKLELADAEAEYKATK